MLPAAGSAADAEGQQAEMNEKVSFTAMEHGTKADYQLASAHDQALVSATAGNVIAWLRQLDGESPYQISRLEHSLQTATRAERDGADDETVVCALLHDIGDLLAPANHSQVAAALLRPYVSEKNHWIIEHHGIFQGYYYFHHFGRDRNVRDRYRDHPWYQDCVDFCARWDQVSFDPDYDTFSLEHFVPKIEALFAKEPAPFV